MRAFHNDLAIKQKYLDRIAAHREAEHLARGIGWETNGETRGCAIGCTLEAYDHARYPIELGIPEWVAHLEDKIFEGLPNADWPSWPTDLLQAIPIGMSATAWDCVLKDLSIRLLRRLRDAQYKAIGDKWGVADAIDQVIMLWANDSKLSESAESAASAAAESAASAKSAAAESARSARSARSAVWAAESAVWAVWAAESAVWAVWAAESAVWAKSAAAESAAVAAVAAESAWKQEADDLIELICEHGDQQET